jgi:hypothetical protein
MDPQNRRGRLGIDVSRETGLNCHCLAGIGHDTNNFLAFRIWRMDMEIARSGTLKIVSNHPSATC